MRRPLILALLLAANVLNVVANAILFEGDHVEALNGLLPLSPALLAVGSLLTAVWVCFLVLRLPDDAAARLWPGFAALGGVGLLTAASQWVLVRQYNDYLSLERRAGAAYQFAVNLPAYQTDAELVVLSAGVVAAIGWLTWAVLACLEARQLTRTPQEA